MPGLASQWILRRSIWLLIELRARRSAPWSCRRTLLGSVLKHRLQHGEHWQGDPHLFALSRLRGDGLGVAVGAIRSRRGRHRPRASPRSPNGPILRARWKPPGSPAASDAQGPNALRVAGGRPNLTRRILLGGGGVHFYVWLCCRDDAARFEFAHRATAVRGRARVFWRGGDE